MMTGKQDCTSPSWLDKQLPVTKIKVTGRVCGLDGKLSNASVEKGWSHGAWLLDATVRAGMNVALEPPAGDTSF